MSIVCPACQTANPSTALFCGQCGGALRAAAAGETPFHGERRQLTALFCDIVNSTAIAKGLDPEDYHEVLRAFVRCCTAVVAPLGGHVAELRGDGALVFFGYPRSHGDEPERAIRAALGIIQAIGAGVTAGGAPLQVRIGVATGVMAIDDSIRGEPAIVGEATEAEMHYCKRSQSQRSIRFSA